MSDEELFNKYFSIFLYYGMSYHEYWNCDPYLIKAYYEKYKYQVEYDNQKLWLQGAYFMSALNTSIANCFNKNSKAEYLKEPFNLFDKPKKEIKKNNEEIRNKVIQSLTIFQKTFNKDKVRC